MDVAETLREKNADLAQNISEDQMQKTAFRTAFDMLKACWPPEYSEDYFTRTWQRFAVAYHDAENNPLCRKLLLSCAQYIEDTAKMAMI